MGDWIPRHALVVGLCVGCGDQPGPTAAESGTDTGGTHGCAPVALHVVGEPGERRFEMLASREEIPGLADQPTATGHIIRSLAAFDGRLHLGFGDSSDNTGPIPMFAYDPTSADFADLGALATEQVFGFADDGDNLYTSAIDPVGHQAEGSVFRLGCGESRWVEGTSIAQAVHVYSATARDGRIHVGTGSLSGQPARLMTSVDWGETWDEVFRLESPPDRFARFYFVGDTGEQLFLSGSVEPAPRERLAWIRELDELVPVTGVPQTGFLAPLMFADRMVIMQVDRAQGAGRHLGTFGLEQGALVPQSPFPPNGMVAAWSVSRGPDPAPPWLWVLMEDAESLALHRSRDLRSWELVAMPPPLAAGERYTSLAVLLNDAYMGTTSGALYVLRGVDKLAG